MLREFRQERLDFARFHKNAYRQIRPMVRKALRQSYQPIIDAVELYDDIRDVPVASLINGKVWYPFYQKIYQIIGMRMAKKEFYSQRRRRGNEEQKASAIEFLADIWSSMLRDYSIKYTYGINLKLDQTTADIITKALGDAYELGIDKWSRIRLFRKDIEHKINSRSLGISRTETTTISNLGKRIGAQSFIEQSGEEGYKVWLGRIVNERPTHLAENDTIIPISQPHIVGGHECDRPGDVTLPSKERINCQCTESYMTAGAYRQYQKRGRIVNNKLVGAS